MQGIEKYARFPNRFKIISLCPLSNTLAQEKLRLPGGEDSCSDRHIHADITKGGFRR